MILLVNFRDQAITLFYITHGFTNLFKDVLFDVLPWYTDHGETSKSVIRVQLTTCRSLLLVGDNRHVQCCLLLLPPRASQLRPAELH